MLQWNGKHNTEYRSKSGTLLYYLGVNIIVLEDYKLLRPEIVVRKDDKLQYQTKVDSQNFVKVHAYNKLQALTGPATQGLMHMIGRKRTKSLSLNKGTSVICMVSLVISMKHALATKGRHVDSPTICGLTLNRTQLFRVSIQPIASDVRLCSLFND